MAKNGITIPKHNLHNEIKKIRKSDVVAKYFIVFWVAYIYPTK